MRKTILLAVAMLGICCGLILSSHSRQSSFPKSQNNPGLQIRAAFRDGLYLGGLAMKRGEYPHVAAGRWSQEADRAAFRAGYRQGYRNGIAVRAGI
jgi:hypothetical protein